jgi:hypothetical protein
MAYKNPEDSRAYWRRWQRTHREARRAAVSRWRKKHPDYEFEQRLKRDYGITLGDYWRLFVDQKGVCAICKKPERRTDPRTKTCSRLAVDHDHTRNKVRGLLCYRCNTAIGLFREDPILLQKAKCYLEAASSSFAIPAYCTP